MHQSLSNCPPNNSPALEEKRLAIIGTKLSAAEESFKQNSRIIWINLGDHKYHNTRFFHKVVNAKRVKHSIKILYSSLAHQLRQ